MSFPVFIHGPEGAQWETHIADTATTKGRWPIGTMLLLERDTRKFRYARKSGAAAVAGNVQQAAANTANHVNLAVATAGVINDRQLAVTLGATAVTINDYEGGFLNIDGVAGTTYIGYAYKIEPHAAVDASATFTVPFVPGSFVQVAIPTTGIASLIRSPYRNVLIAPTTLTQVVAGIAVVAIPANRWGWLQTGGPASVIIDTVNTIVLGQSLIPSTTTAGQAESLTGTYATARNSQPILGYASRVPNTDNDAMLVFLTLE